jgi:hypothetical protein
MVNMRPWATKGLPDDSMASQQRIEPRTWILSLPIATNELDPSARANPYLFSRGIRRPNTSYCHPAQAAIPGAQQKPGFRSRKKGSRSPLGERQTQASVMHSGTAGVRIMRIALIFT